MTEQHFTVPVLFLIFNRPQTTEKVFQRIREIRPKYLYVSADGPRVNKEHEKELCESTRKLIEKVDWECEVKTHFSDINLGCKIGVSSGINWFFEHVEEGIILEDDCLPDLSFFSFCEVMLKKYRHNDKIMHIGGTNFQDGIHRGSGSYYFSNINHVWGWATWQRAWRKYDITISSYHDLLQQNYFKQVFSYSLIEKFWKKKFELAYTNRIDTWDIQWQYAMSVHNGLAIIPNKNLVSNIGFHDSATHTVDKFNTLSNIPSFTLNNIIDPSEIRPDLMADVYAFRKYFSPSKLRKLWYLIIRRLNTNKIFNNQLSLLDPL